MTNLPLAQRSDQQHRDHHVGNDDDVDNDDDLEVSLDVHLLQLLLALQRESVERLRVRDAHLGLVLQHIFTSSCSKIFLELFQKLNVSL